MTIPNGVCLDLETTITHKIPDHIRPPGQKRYETRIIEIGAVLWHNPNLTYRAIVNPIGKNVKLNTSQDLFQHLRDIHQHPTRTLNFWSRVLVKGKVLTRDMFHQPEDPEVWLARRIDTRVKDFVRWHKYPKTGPTFVSEEKALRGLLSFTEKHTVNAWLAHNGHSFDYKVLQGCAMRCNMTIPKHIQTLDTLKIFRKVVPGLKSYSQPVFYKHVFDRHYNAHIAIDDARALSDLCRHLGHNTVQHISTTPAKNSIHVAKKKSMDLTFPIKSDRNVSSNHVRIAKKKIGTKVTSLKGIGPKTAAALAVLNIVNVQQLCAAYKKNGKEWLKDILPYGARWRIISQSIETL